MADAEVIVIGIDNSRWLPNSSAIFKDQCDAIEFYCRAKFEENPDTVVGLFTMSSCDCGHLLYPPTGSLEEIVAKLPTINSGSGQVDLLTTFTSGRLPFLLNYQDKQKRMTLFVGGLTNLATVFVNSFGKGIRDLGVAVDVIDLSLSEPPKPFTLEYQFGRRHLEEFINICNGNDNYNSHIVHVGPTDSICAVLSESILKKTPRLFQKDNGNVKRRVGGEESSAALCAALSESKLKKTPRPFQKVNVNVNWRVGGEESSAARGKKNGEHVTLLKGGKNRVLEEENVNVERWYMDQFVNISNGNDNNNSHIVHVGPTDSIRAESILKRTPRLFQKDNVNDKRRVGGEESSAARGNKLLEEKNVNVKRRVAGEESSAARGNKYGQHVTLLKGGKNRALEEKNVDVKRRVGGEESSAARGIKYKHVTLSKKKTGEA